MSRKADGAFLRLGGGLSLGPGGTRTSRSMHAVVSFDELTHNVQARNGSAGLNLGPWSGHQTIGRILPASRAP
jgi:hypothetical protein